MSHRERNVSLFYRRDSGGSTQCLSSNRVRVWEHVLNMVANFRLSDQPIILVRPQQVIPGAISDTHNSSNNSKPCILECPSHPPTFPRHPPATMSQFHEITGLIWHAGAYLSSEPVSLLFIQLASKQIIPHRLRRGLAFARRIILDVEPMEVVLEGAVPLAQ